MDGLRKRCWNRTGPSSKRHLTLHDELAVRGVKGLAQCGAAPMSRARGAAGATSGDLVSTREEQIAKSRIKW
jgi:hypothetical protein